jgi:hypothetical protein
MRAISLWQPWASFIAAELKPFETRDWPPPQWLIGQRIAIHAAKRPVNADNKAWAASHGCHQLPLGAVVCAALLIGAYQCGDTVKEGLVKILRRIEMPEHAHIDPGGVPTDEFGDYAPGRWAWRLTDIELLDPPIPARGAQGFWKWYGA